MARDGISQPRSDIEAVRWFRQAVEVLDDYAMANLGRMHWEGRGGLAIDRAEAVRLWRKSAFYANPRVRFWLAEALERGEGTGRDVAEATALYHAVAEQDRDLDLKRRAADAIKRLGAAAQGEGAPPDEIFSHEDIIKGKTMTRAECGAHEHAVWVEHAGGSECIRYFPSGNIDQSPLVVFYFHGDRAGGGQVLGGYRNNTRNTQMALAARNSQENRAPWIIVDHGKMRQPKEDYSLNAAVDAIKAKHKIGRIVLAGQSGGATTTGALLTLGRTDVGCTVGTSGGYAAIARADRLRPVTSPKRGLDTTGLASPYEPINEVAGIKTDPRRRIFIIGDPKDSNTFFDLQEDFGKKLAAAGHHAVVATAAARGASHHDLTLMSYKAAGWCAAGLSDREIIERVQRNAPPIGVEPTGAAMEPAAPARQEVGTRINIDSMARGKKERIWGFLSFPSKPQAKYPLMLIMHSSGGITSATGSLRGHSMTWGSLPSCSTVLARAV